MCEFSYECYCVIIKEVVGGTTLLTVDMIWNFIKVILVVQYYLIYDNWLRFSFVLLMHIVGKIFRHVRIYILWIVEAKEKITAFIINILTCFCLFNFLVCYFLNRVGSQAAVGSTLSVLDTHTPFIEHVHAKETCFAELTVFIGKLSGHYTTPVL